MLDALTHRGPDGQGVKALREGRVLLGHRRLSIIDLSPAGAQPMSNEDGTVWITFNGEIYNYRALRVELSNLGHQFRSDSDTEVIVHAWEEWGRNCVKRLRGIFAFGLWDEHVRELFLARDQMGVKPLYYAEYGGCFTFASQPRAILADDTFPKGIDATGLRDYFAFGYVPRDRCAFAGMRKLPAGHWLLLKDGHIETEEYWRVEYRPERIDAHEAVAKIQYGLSEAVAMQLVSDVPVGCFLSGGIDSSLLVALATEGAALRTFTIGFDEAGSDERIYARKVAEQFGTSHCEQVLSRQHIRNALSEIVEYYDEPFDPNGPMPFMAAAALARGNGTIVALGGDGADELFMGYRRYDNFDRPAGWTGRYGPPLWRWLRRLDLVGWRDATPDDAERYFFYEGCRFGRDELLSPAFMNKAEGSAMDTLRPYFQSGVPALVAAQLADMNHYLVDHILTKIDRAAMAFGVEARVPFLDIELVRTAFSVPVELNYARAERKALLKRAASKFLDRKTLSSRKKGFSSPLTAWLDLELRSWGDSVIQSGMLVSEGIVRPDWRERLAMDGRTHAWSKVRVWWLVLAAELWCRRWLAGERMKVYDA
jgi:asparagine synthase (glutamine-hydrolysing)